VQFSRSDLPIWNDSPAHSRTQDVEVRQTRQLFRMSWTFFISYSLSAELINTLCSYHRYSILLHTYGEQLCQICYKISVDSLSPRLQGIVLIGVFWHVGKPAQGGLRMKSAYDSVCRTGKRCDYAVFNMMTSPNGNQVFSDWGDSVAFCPIADQITNQATILIVIPS